MAGRCRLPPGASQTGPAAASHRRSPGCPACPLGTGVTDLAKRTPDPAKKTSDPCPPGRELPVAAALCSHGSFSGHYERGVGKKSKGPSRHRPCLSAVCRRPTLAAAEQLQRTGELVVGGGAAARVARRGRRRAWAKLHLNQWKPKIEYIWYISFVMYLDITYV
jgi:hypothetical protein